MGDDGVNIGGTYLPVVDQPDPYTLVIEAHGSIGQYSVSELDLVSVDRITHGHFYLGTATNKQTVQVAGYSTNCFQLTFTNPLPDMETYLETLDKNASNKVINLNACGRGAIIQNNHFYMHRARGILMRAPDSLIEGNLFDTIAGPAIVVSNDGGFLTEGPSGDGATIQNNTFTNVERSNIWINSSIADDSATATEGVVGLTISNNTFSDYGGENIHGRGQVGNVFWVKNASDLVISNNTIGNPAIIDPASVIIQEYTDNLNWTDNTRIGGVLVDFDNYTISSYGVGQDGQGLPTSAVTSQGGLTVHLTGNCWKKIPINYTITSSTILEFEVSATDLGEIIGIGLDEDNDHNNAKRGFQLGGSQTWGNCWQETNTYTSDTKSYKIAIGSFYTGTKSNLVFIADDDANGSTDVTFTNILLYENP